MEKYNKMPVLLLLFICLYPPTVLGVREPEDLDVKIVDGEVIVYWKQPVGAPSNSTYNVQMARYIDIEWAKVKTCTRISNTFCELSSLIHDYNGHYKVRVQLVAGDSVSPWTSKRIRPYESELLPPSFTLVATSSTLSVYVNPKPILRKLFPFGLTYTIYLEETEHEKTTTAYLKDDVGDDERTRTFKSLHWGRQYCVSMKVEGNGARFPSPVCPKQCLVLPDREWFAIATSSLTVSGVLAVLAISAIILLCYLKRPEKTPAALKSPPSYWHPLPVEEATVETVTDKGWFLSSSNAEVKNPLTHVMVKDYSGDDDRRTSMDSGVSLESSSATHHSRTLVLRQEDSGCGSMGEPESTTSSQTDYQLQEERTDVDCVQKRQESSVELGCQTSSILHVDTELLKDSGSGSNYRTQSPPQARIHVSEDEGEFKQRLEHVVLAEVVTGYRASPQLCICSGAGHCTWCHTQGQQGSEVLKQYQHMCGGNGSLSLMNSFNAGNTFSSCYRKSKTDTVTVNGFKDTFTQLEDTFPLLTSLPPLSLLEGGRDFNMNDVCLSLSDVQLETD